jgi:CheY-like chemotaxis protein
MCMPGLDGLELARRVTADPVLRGLPMVMLSSSLRPDRQGFADAGIGEWLSKPVRSWELFERLMRLLTPTRAVVAAGSSDRPPSAAVPSGGDRILVVEDNVLNQMVAKGVVTRLGYEVDCVADGAEALVAVQSNRYAAVLMDCHMPGMDGFTATREIREREAGRERIPIIAMTAGALVEDQEQCRAAGMDDHVAKPIDVAVLQAALARWVGGSGAAEPEQSPDLPGRVRDASLSGSRE